MIALGVEALRLSSFRGHSAGPRLPATFRQGWHTRFLTEERFLIAGAVSAKQASYLLAIKRGRRDQGGEKLGATRVLSRLRHKMQQEVKTLINLLWPRDECAAPHPTLQSHLDLATSITYNKHMIPGRLSSVVNADSHAGTLAFASGGALCDVEPIRVAGRVLEPTPVFDTYWRFAAARQAVYMARVDGRPGPWTRDPILLRHRFTNCYRAADRVSQYMITNISYAGAQAWEEVFFRTIIFKMFNRISTWQLLQDTVGDVRWDAYSFSAYNDALSRAFQAGEKLYSAAYVMPAPRLTEVRKHSNHLRLLELMMRSSAPQRVQDSATMKDAFVVLRDFPGMGDFLAYQYLIDLNYSAALDFDEMEFVVPGPGARDGIRKCLGPASTGIEDEIIRYMADRQEEHFARLGLTFPGLWGRRLQLIDCQNLFCEVDKYARVAHPEVAGLSGRTRIKQTFRRDPAPVAAWFPPKWNINARIGRVPRKAGPAAGVRDRDRTGTDAGMPQQLPLG